jgi:serine phosphatase RsbU (regulator of sigma subunit)
VGALGAVVGGYFFDVTARAAGSRLIVIADVMGKGVPAALMAATLRTALRALATNSEGPGELLTRVNHQLCADLGSIDMFITAQIVWLETGGAAVRFANAGHCSPLLFAPEPAAPVKWWDDVGGLPIGVSSRERYEEARHQVREGARAWLMTDGALETENARGEQLGTDGFALLARDAGDPAALLSALEARASEHAASDDCTLIHFKRRATAPA